MDTGTESRGPGLPSVPGVQVARTWTWVWKERCSEGFTGEAGARITEQGCPFSPHYPNTRQALGEGDSKDLGSGGKAGTVPLGGTCSGSLQSPLWRAYCALTAACALPSRSPTAEGAQGGSGPILML